MAYFADINVSQGSVATYARCGEMFNIHLTANLLRNLPVKKFCKSVKIWQNYGRESVAPFFLAHTVYMLTKLDSVVMMMINSVTAHTVCHSTLLCTWLLLLLHKVLRMTAELLPESCIAAPENSCGDRISQHAYCRNDVNFLWLLWIWEWRGSYFRHSMRNM